MNTIRIQPQALLPPEIVLAIGKAIPLWFPQVVRGRTVWWFRPKDLVAAIAVNRLFHTVLTPILWTVFAYPCDRSHKYYSHIYQESGRLFEFVPEVVKKNSEHFRYLDLSLDNTMRNVAKFGLLELNCIRLQELRITTSIDLALLGHLIAANPGLRLLHWSRTRSQRKGLLKFLYPLSQLRSLRLKGEWDVNPVSLHHILSNNAACLEELELGEYSRILDADPMNEQWNGLEASALSSMKKRRYARAIYLIQGRSLLLPKLKSLRLLVSWRKTSDATHTLVRAFPALETITLLYIDKEDGSRLGRNLQEFCSNLRSIRDPDRYYDNSFFSLIADDGISQVVDACSPGSLVRASLAIWVLQESLRVSLLKHRDVLEVLELSLSHDVTLGNIENIRMVLEGCKRLKRFAVYNGYKLYNSPEETRILLEGLVDCRELESVVLVGFPHVGLMSMVNVEAEMAAIDNYRKKHRDEHPPFPETLPADWRYVPVSIARSNISVSTKEFRLMAFAAISHLPRMKSLVLNCDSFERSPSLLLV
ncbi:hypothetical protein BGW39_011495 [Mortierella sp. 14UC]|nr:hypothetical protein BGW39_011495 [Mortierella sp. 14UC]